MVFPVAMVLVIANVLILSSPRTYFRDESRMVKFDANIDAVSLRQSVQLQTNYQWESVLEACMWIAGEADLRC